MLRKLTILSLLVPSAAFAQVEPNEDEVQAVHQTWRDRQSLDELKEAKKLQEAERRYTWGLVCDVKVIYAHFSDRVVLDDPTFNYDTDGKHHRVGDHVKLAFAITTPPPPGWSVNTFDPNSEKFWPTPEKAFEGEHLVRIEYFYGKNEQKVWTQEQPLPATPFLRMKDPHLRKLDRAGIWRVQLTLVKKAKQHCQNCETRVILNKKYKVLPQEGTSA